jgi:hypothetical protein
MKNKDLHKNLRDSMDQTLETKFMQNLQWSMLFFCFNYIANHINEEHEFKDKHVHKEFIKTWKKFANENIVGSDLKIINSPKNIFYSALQNSNEVTESTEIYQEKYNNILNKIEKFFLETLSTQQKFDPPDEDEDNEYA